MTFNHELIKNLPELEQINTDSGRFYLTPEGNRYSSVTTILGTMSDKSGLDQWRERVGAREADRIGNQAATRGTHFHSLCEDYVLNREVDVQSLMPLDKQLFNQTKKVLDANLTTLRGSESRLYSNKLKSAGSCDLICDWNGELAIGDFKTSAKPKDKEYILNYFLQTTAYSYMLWEQHRMMCKKIVVIIACDSLPHAQVYIEDPRKYIDKVVDMFDTFDYNNKHG